MTKIHIVPGGSGRMPRIAYCGLPADYPVLAADKGHLYRWSGRGNKIKIVGSWRVSPIGGQEMREEVCKKCEEVLRS